MSCRFPRATAGLLAVLLAACAHRAPVVPLQPIPPARVVAMVQVAEADWLRWGAMDVRVPAGPADSFCAVLGDGTCATVDDGCGQEQSPALCPVVDEYWTAVNPGDPPRHACTQVPHCEAHWDPAWGAPDWTPPWSAAWISAVLRRAGIVDGEFAFSDTHADYVTAARDHRTSAFLALPTPAVPQVGDLACATREAHPGDAGPRRLEDVRGNRHGRGGTPMHCDLVVDVDAVGHRIAAIGGNVQQTVARSVVALDDQGRLSPDLNPARPWIALLRPLTTAPLPPGIAGAARLAP